MTDLSKLSNDQLAELYPDDLLPGQTVRLIGNDGDGRPKWCLFRCPIHSTMVCRVAISPQKQSNGASWQWDGNLSEPTLSPSIDCKSCGWHGWLKAGKLERC